MILQRLHLRRFFQTSSKTFNARNQQHTSYYVLLPEVPEGAEIDKCIRLPLTDFPKFEDWTPFNAYMGIGKLSLEFESGIRELEETLQGDSSPSVSDVIKTLEELHISLSLPWNTAKLLYIYNNEEYPHQTYYKIHKRAQEARSLKFASLPLYNAFKANEKAENLNAFQKRVMKKYLLEGRLNGLDLEQGSKKDTFMFALTNIKEFSAKYDNNLKTAQSRFSQLMPGKEIMKDFPVHLRDAMALNESSDPSKGPWSVSLNPKIYPLFLEYCPEKMFRYNIWKAYVMRGSLLLDRSITNSIPVEEIRLSRKDIAEVLGYKTFADMSMETKMAGSVENVLSMIATLALKAKDVQSEEMKSLQELSEKNGQGSLLEACDIPYWRREQRKLIYSFDESTLCEYFPFDHVWQQLLQLISKLFGITFEEIPSGKVSTMHPDVKVFQIHDSDGSYLGAFYMDPYQRPKNKLALAVGDGYMSTLRNRSDDVGCTPLVSLIFNFMQPTPENPVSLLSFKEVHVLFYKFGEALQPLLTTVPYSEVSGQTNVEWDALETCSNFLKNWLRDPSVLKSISKNCHSGEPLPDAQIKDLIASQSHGAGYDLCNELFLSHFDLMLYSDNSFWFPIMKGLLEKYSPFPFDNETTIPSWCSDIITGQWAAGYYSHTWSKMLAADAYQAFQECEPQDVEQIGRRFRQTFLRLGGGAPAAEVFRSFRGRDPAPDALTSLYGWK